MSGFKFALGALSVAFGASFLSSAADATHRWCGFDPYGYHAPCRYLRHAYREGWGFYPAYGFYPEGSYYSLPRYPVYAVPAPAYPVYPAAFCYYDNGYDFRVRRVCVPSW